MYLVVGVGQGLRRRDVPIKVGNSAASREMMMAMAIRPGS